MKFDIIIPYFNEAQVTVRCIESVIKYSKNYRIIATSDGSWHRKIQHVTKALEPSEACLHLRDRVNIGFPGNINRALKVTTAEFVAVINSDIEIKGDWLSVLENEYLRRGGKCFIGKAGQNVNRAGQGIGSPTHPEVDYLGWWLIFSSKECFDRVGLLDEHFKIGYYEDVDYGLRAKRLGLKNIVYRGVPATHLGGATMNKVNQEVLKQARRNNFLYLKKKWGW